MIARLLVLLLMLPLMLPLRGQEVAEPEVAEGRIPPSGPQEARELALKAFGTLADPQASRQQKEAAVVETIDAALAGDAVALNNLGYMTSTGEGNLIIPDPEMALYWFTQAMDQGYNAAAINILDLEERHPELTIPQEDLARANRLMGDAYAKGYGAVPYNFDLSLKHYLRAARLGDEKAIEMLRELLGQFPDALGPLSDEDKELLYP